MREGERKKNEKTRRQKTSTTVQPLARWGWRHLLDRDGDSCPIGVGNCSPMAVASQARQVGRLLPDVAKILSGRRQQGQEDTGMGILLKSFGR